MELGRVQHGQPPHQRRRLPDQLVVIRQRACNQDADQFKLGCMLCVRRSTVICRHRISNRQQYTHGLCTVDKCSPVCIWLTRLCSAWIRLMSIFTAACMLW